MHLRYVFSELIQGLRRNVSMHVAVVLTLFVSLTLVGLGLLLNRQAATTLEYFGSELEITVWMCKDDDPDASCAGGVSQAQRDAIVEVVKENPEVAGHRLESKERAYEKLQDLHRDDPLFQGADAVVKADAMRESVWIELKNPDKYEGITSAVVGLDGVASLGDQRDNLAPLLASIKALSRGALGAAVFLIAAAVLMVANTIRLAALARRREIGIMRLVGASSLYIALPFLLEALVTAAIGVLLSAGVLAGFMKFVVNERAQDRIKFTPWIDWPDFYGSMLWVGVLGAALTILPTLVLTRKYLNV
jgi:cell division transport system permease protein